MLQAQEMSMSRIRQQEQELYNLYRQYTIINMQLQVMEALGHNDSGSSILANSVYLRTEIQHDKVLSAIKQAIAGAAKTFVAVKPPHSNRGAKK